MRFRRSEVLKSILALALVVATAPFLRAAGEAAQTQKSTGAPKMDAKSATQVAVLKTSAGTIKFELLPNLAPEHVKNFVDLVTSGFYDGTKFHRVIPKFMIQGGDPNTKTADVNSWGTGNGPRRLRAEFSPPEKARHVRGMVSMARTSDPNSASCQFFIMHGDSPSLDGQYSIFGRVVSGMEVVDKIATAPTAPGTDRPVDPVTIEKATIETK